MARYTLAGPLARVRELAAAAPADYSDDALEAVLDRNRRDFADDRLTPLAQNEGGTVRFYVHQSAWRNLEESGGGTAVLVLRDSARAVVGTADYSIDAAAGRVTFGQDTGGSAFYLSGRSYDLYAAAAEVCRMKAAAAADRMDFAADGASFKASQLVKQYTDMAALYGALATFGASSAGLRTTTLVRDDLAPDVWR